VTLPNIQTCKRGIWDSRIPGITFDEKGVSNYAVMFDSLCNAYPRGTDGEKDWSDLVKRIKKKGKNKAFDCIIGVSGGTDSSYLLYLAKQYGLRPLAVNLDNGWNSEIAVRNIRKITQKLNIALITYVINYEEVKYVLRSYLKASLPWIDSPTDLAIKAVLYKIAKQENIKFILNGSDFRSEGKQPTEWTYSDAKQMKYLVKKFEHQKIRSFPYYTLTSLFYYGFVLGIKMYRPFYYIDYQKKIAQEFLIKNFEWEYYGGHHHENRFTKFAIAYWLPQKFGIDKRLITLSAQVLSGEITRESAIEQMKHEPFSAEELKIETDFVLKKLDFTTEEFSQIWNSPNKFYYDYPSYMPLLKKYYVLSKILLSKVLPFKPSMFFENTARNK
jgi:N-acetyl sugar amidotransferase